MSFGESLENPTIPSSEQNSGNIEKEHVVEEKKESVEEVKIPEIKKSTEIDDTLKLEQISEEAGKTALEKNQNLEPKKDVTTDSKVDMPKVEIEDVISKMEAGKNLSSVEVKIVIDDLAIRVSNGYMPADWSPMEKQLTAKFLDETKETITGAINNKAELIINTVADELGLKKPNKVIGGLSQEASQSYPEQNIIKLSNITSTDIESLAKVGAHELIHHNTPFSELNSYLAGKSTILENLPENLVNEISRLNNELKSKIQEWVDKGDKYYFIDNIDKNYPVRQIIDEFVTIKLTDKLIGWNQSDYMEEFSHLADRALGEHYSEFLKVIADNYSAKLMAIKGKEFKVKSLNNIVEAVEKKLPFNRSKTTNNKKDAGGS